VHFVWSQKKLKGREVAEALHVVGFVEIVLPAVQYSQLLYLVYQVLPQQMEAPVKLLAFKDPGPAVSLQHVWVVELNPRVFPPHPESPQQVPLDPDYILSVKMFPAQHVLSANVYVVDPQHPAVAVVYEVPLQHAYPADRKEPPQHVPDP